MSTAEGHIDPSLERIEDAFELQQEFVQSEPVLPNTILVDCAGFTGKNPGHAASRWRRGGKIFAVLYHGQLLYPEFQFDDQGQPYSSLKRVLAILRRDPSMTDWDIALWFTTPAGMLNGEKPKSLLVSHSKDTINRLVRAAEEEVTADEGG